MQSFFNKQCQLLILNQIKKMIHEALESFGLKKITDSDIMEIQDLISSIDQDDRFKLGNADFYGYSTDFLKNIKRWKVLKKLMEAISKVRVLNKKNMN